MALQLMCPAQVLLTEIFSGDGKLIRQFEGVNQIDLGNLPASAYMVKIRTENNTYHQMVLKK